MREIWVRSWVRKIPWRRKWQPTPVFLPGESHGWRSLVGYSPWGRKESDTTERLHPEPRTQCRKGLILLIGPYHSGLPGGSVIKNSPANVGDARDMGLIPGLGRFPWSRKWQPTSVFLPGKSHRQRSYSPWGHKKSDTTQRMRVHAHTHTHTHTYTKTFYLGFYLIGPLVIKPLTPTDPFLKSNTNLTLSPLAGTIFTWFPLIFSST